MLDRTKFLTGATLQLRNRRIDLLLQAGREASPELAVTQTRLRRDRETRRYRQAGTRHLGQAGALSAQQRRHAGAPFVEKINVLRRITAHAGNSRRSRNTASSASPPTRSCAIESRDRNVTLPSSSVS